MNLNKLWKQRNLVPKSLTLITASTIVPLFGQSEMPGPPAYIGPGGPGPVMRGERMHIERRGGPALGTIMPGPHGRWWADPEVAQKLGLTTEQKNKMDDVLQQSRLKLIDLNAALQKEEVILQPLLSAETPDEAKILSEIDKISQARAELEKANATMLFRLRAVLTKEQWQKLQAEHSEWRGGRERRPGPGGMPAPPRPPHAAPAAKPAPASIKPL